MATPMYDPYRTGRPESASVTYGMAYDSIAMTSWTPKELAGRYYMPSFKKAPTAAKVAYLHSQSNLNHNTYLRHGSQFGLTGPRSTSASTYTWKDPAALSRPPSAVLERMYDELVAPVMQKSLNPLFAPLPADLPRSVEEHAVRAPAAIAQHRLRTRISSRHIPIGAGWGVGSRPTTVDVPAAEGETGYTKSGPVYLRSADGGRTILHLRYPGDADPAAAFEAAEAISAASRGAAPRFTMTQQVPGHGYRPRTAEDYDGRAIASLDGRTLLQMTRKPAPDHLRKPEHPRRKAQISTVRPYDPSKLGAPPSGYVLVSDDYEKTPEYMRTSKEREMLGVSTGRASAGAF